MSEIAALTAEKRQQVGTSSAKRLRATGQVPGSLYGRGGETVAFAVQSEQLDPVIRSGAKVVDITIDGTTEIAVVKEVQWNTWITEIHHLDLQRVDRSERITLDVAFEFRGVAPGVVGGGHLERPLHSLNIECPAVSIPDKITVRIGSLEIEDAVLVSDLELDGDITVNTPADTVVVRVVAPSEEEEELEVADGPAEPEVIGKKEEAEDGE
ncbi:MAG: 50S ribosomal protein L25 [Planctomycetaceae bacterium]|nr:50S ribosomal protein L25 [Planctomycetaceae bacterium]